MYYNTKILNLSDLNKKNATFLNNNQHVEKLAKVELIIEAKDGRVRITIEAPYDRRLDKEVEYLKLQGNEKRLTILRSHWTTTMASLAETLFNSTVSKNW